MIQGARNSHKGRTDPPGSGHPTGHMNSQQLLPHALHDQPRDAAATIVNGLEPYIVGELESPIGPQKPNWTLRRDSRYRRLLVAADVSAGAVASGPPPVPWTLSELTVSG